MAQIWVLSEIYFPEQTSTGYLLTKIAEGLAQEFSAGVITGPPTNFMQSAEAPPREDRNGVTILRCQGTRLPKDSAVGRILNMLTRSAAIFWRSVRHCQRGDVILVVTNPPVLPLVALAMKWMKGCRFVLLIHDVYPDVLVTLDLAAPSSAVVKIGLWVNRVLYRESSRIITLGRDMTHLVMSRVSENRARVRCIPHWAENESVHPTDRSTNPFLKELGITDKFVILYAGNIGRTHGIECIAEAAKQLNANPSIHFVFVGFGAKQGWLEEFVDTHHLRNVSIRPFRPRSEQNITLNACDIGVISFVKSMAGISVPSRMYNQMAAAKPIIALADDASELALVLREEEIGWVLQPEDVNGLVKAIKFAAANPELCRQLGTRAASVASTTYSFERANHAYRSLFREVLRE